MKQKLLFAGLALASVFSLPTDHWPLTTAQAAKVKVWQQHTPAHYEKAQLTGAVISSEGCLRLSRQLKPLCDLNVTHVWDVVEDQDGNLLVATGDEGKINAILNLLSPFGLIEVVRTGKVALGRGVAE